MSVLADKRRQASLFAVAKAVFWSFLGIRRKTGILGQFKVSGVSAEGGIANPLPGFGPFQPKIGDDLILPPQY